MLIIMYTRGICTFWNLLGRKAHRQYMRSAQRNEQEESRMKHWRCRRREAANTEQSLMSAQTRYETYVQSISRS